MRKILASLLHRQVSPVRLEFGSRHPRQLSCRSLRHEIDLASYQRQQTLTAVSRGLLDSEREIVRAGSRRNDQVLPCARR
jgi:hypothetical protein